MARLGGGTFAVQIDDWVANTNDKMLRIFQQAAQEVIAKMQEPGPSKSGGGGTGHMPIDTGFLRASLLATLNSPTSEIKVANDDVRGWHYSEGQTSLVILGAKLGDTIYAVYTAAYARRMEYGFSGTDSLGRSYNQQGYGFVRLAAQQWSEVVAEVVRKVKV